MVRYVRLNKLCNALEVQYVLLELLIFLSALNSFLATASEESIPVFEPRENNITVHAGDTVTLRCAVRGLQTRFVVWRRMSEPNPLTIGDLVYIPDNRISLRRVEKRHEWNLIIKDVNPNDAGVYECGVSSREKYRTHIILRVIGSTYNRKGIKENNERVRSNNKPSVVLTGKEFVSKGQHIILFCNATGDEFAPDAVDWFINGHKVIDRNMPPRVRIYNDNDKRTLYSTLEIRRADMDDKGIYVCRGPDQKTDSMTIHVLDEEKSIMNKRVPGKGSQAEGSSDSAMSCWSVWYKTISLYSVCIVIWFTHFWYIT